MTAEIKTQRPPDWLFKNLINPTIKAILRSPLHGILSGNLLILHFQGRKTGKAYSTPVGYHRLDEKTVLLMTRSPWWKNLNNAEEILLRLAGKDSLASAEVITDKTIVWDYISRFLKENPDPRRIGIMLSKDSSPEVIRQAASDLVAIRLQLDESA